MISKEQVLELLEAVRDPEVPVLSVVDLGVVRDVTFEENVVRVKLTPTYSGCPALEVMKRGIEERLRESTAAEVIVEITYAPPWTTDWISEAGRRKLKEYGIAPPAPVATDSLVSIGRTRVTIPCPFCGSRHTEIRSEFGATACKALHYCNSCQQPFEHFKPF